MAMLDVSFKRMKELTGTLARELGTSKFDRTDFVFFYTSIPVC